MKPCQQKIPLTNNQWPIALFGHSKGNKENDSRTYIQIPVALTIWTKMHGIASRPILHISKHLAFEEPPHQTPTQTTAQPQGPPWWMGPFFFRGGSLFTLFWWWWGGGSKKRGLMDKCEPGPAGWVGCGVKSWKIGDPLRVQGGFLEKESLGSVCKKKEAIADAAGWIQ